jgi:hypothetical protein
MRTLRPNNVAFIRRVRCLTLERAQSMLHSGTLAQADYDRYSRLWDWSAARFSGTAGDCQLRYTLRHGQSACDQRIERVMRVVVAIRQAA